MKNKTASFYQPLFDHMHQEHGLTLLESEMADIINIVRKMDAAECAVKGMPTLVREGYVPVIEQGAVWVKASERLPNDYMNHNCKLNGKPIILSYKKHHGLFYNYDGDFFPPDQVEWLDESGSSTIDNECRVNADYLCTFTSFDQWVNKASSWIGGVRRGTLICIDTAGNMCLIGEDFMAARDHGLFPVKAYRMIKTIEAV